MEWYVFALISAFLSSMSPIIRKKVLYKQHTSEYLTTAYYLMAIVLLPFLPRVDFGMGWLAFWLIVFKGIVLAIASLFFIKAFRHLEISSIEPLRNLSIIFLVFLGYFFLGDVINLKEGAGIILLLAGSYFLEINKHGTKYSLPNKKYLLYAIIGISMTSILPLLDKIVLQHTDIYTLLVLPTFFTAGFFMIYQFSKYRGFTDILHTIKVSGTWIAVIVFLKIISDLSYLAAVAIPTSLIALVIALRRTSTLITTFVGGEIFHDHNLSKKIFASLIMLAGVYLIIF